MQGSFLIKNVVSIRLEKTTPPTFQLDFCPTPPAQAAQKLNRKMWGYAWAVIIGFYLLTVGPC